MHQQGNNSPHCKPCRRKPPNFAQAPPQESSMTSDSAPHFETRTQSSPPPRSSNRTPGKWHHSSSTIALPTRPPVHAAKQTCAPATSDASPRHASKFDTASSPRPAPRPTPEDCTKPRRRPSPFDRRTPRSFGGSPSPPETTWKRDCSPRNPTSRPPTIPIDPIRVFWEPERASRPPRPTTVCPIPWW